MTAHVRPRRRSLTARLALVALMIPSAGHAVAGTRQLEVDVNRPGGVMKPLLHGGTGDPGPAPGRPDLIPMAGFWRAAKLRFVRTGAESWAPLDTVDNPNSLFPKWSADPEDPASYNFSDTDAWVKQSLAAGVQLSFSVHFQIPGAMTPPEDLAKYERVVEHIVRHYDRGWANGLQDAIRNWDFGDEPDLGDVHWRGTPDQYYAMYGAVARAVKRVDPKLQVGGLSIAFALSPDSPYREGFLDYVRTNRLPLDFFTWKYMADASRDPMDFAVIARDLRGVLDAKGFQSTELFLSAWAGLVLPVGLNGAQPPLNPTELAAYHTASLIYLQDAPVTLAAMDKLGADNVSERADPARPDLKPSWTPDPRFVGVRLMGQALGNDERLTARGGDDKGFTLLASKQRRGRKIDVVIANYAIPTKYLAPRQSDVATFTIPSGIVQRYAIRGGTMALPLPPQRSDAAPSGDDAYVLNVHGLKRRPYIVSRYRLDVDHKGELVSSERLTGPVLQLRARLAAPAVELVEINPAP